jgi:hypothetical protein
MKEVDVFATTDLAVLRKAQDRLEELRVWVASAHRTLECDRPPVSTADTSFTRRALFK